MTSPWVAQVVERSESIFVLDIEIDPSFEQGSEQLTTSPWVAQMVERSESIFVLDIEIDPSFEQGSEQIAIFILTLTGKVEQRRSLLLRAWGEIYPCFDELNEHIF